MKIFTKTKKVLSVMIIATLMMTVFLGINKFTPGSHVQAATISSLTKEQARIEKQIASLKAEKNALNAKNQKLQGELSWLNSRTADERKQYEKLVDELNDAYKEMEASLAKAKLAEDNVKTKQEQYKKRLQTMFENRNKGTLEMLFDAKDLSAFLANVQIISIIADNDKKVLSELNAAKDEAYLKKKEAEEYSEEMQAYVNKKNKEIEALKKNMSQTKTAINDVKSDLSKAEKDEKALVAESNKIGSEIKKLQSTARYYGGSMVWPTPGYPGVGDNFGMRFHPILKYWRMHNGIDIVSPFNSKIVAVADGKVIVAQTISGYNPVSGNNYGGGGYGNYIIIDHGGGVSTVYAHCKLIKVWSGTTVKAGQWIAVTGSTGLSTGAHLHFEVREGGIPANPLQKKYLGSR